MGSVYIHIPFCKRRCNYCDFITYANIESMLPDYLKALETEIKTSKMDTDPLDTLYFGGGTPSILHTDQIEALLKAIRSRYGLSKEAEITFEANPGTVAGDYFRRLRSLGINRLSMGVQSFADLDLRALGRIHSAADALRSFEAARHAGFENISIDLIYGLPGQTLQAWQANLAALADLRPEHLSLYSLILEPGTLLNRWVEKGLVALPDDDAVADMFEETMRFLVRIGYEYYEISSWALGEEMESRHNKVYWRGQNYLGFGAGAVGSVDGFRWRNSPNVKEYILKINSDARRQNRKVTRFHIPSAETSQPDRPLLGRAVVETELLSNQDRMKEVMMLGLRMTREGVSEKAFYDRFKVEMRKIFSIEIDKLLEKGLIRWVSFPDGFHLVLSPRGFLLGNQVFKEFV